MSTLINTKVYEFKKYFYLNQKNIFNYLMNDVNGMVTTCACCNLGSISGVTATNNNLNFPSQQGKKDGSLTIHYNVPVFILRCLLPISIFRIP